MPPRIVTSRDGDTPGAGLDGLIVGLGHRAAADCQPILDAVPDLICILDPDHTIRYANRSLAQRLGLKPEELVGGLCHERLNCCDRPSAHCPHAHSLEDGREHAGEFEIKSLGGWFAVTVSPVNDAGGGISGLVFVARDISRRKRLENLLAARVRLGEFTGTHSPTELLRATLDEAERLTGSQVGFLHFVEADQKNISLQVWSTNTFEKMCRAEGTGRHYPIEQAGVWVDCIRERGPVIHNDYASLPHRKGLPPGHAPIVRAMVVPVLRSGRVVAVLGVGNKPSNYTERDIDTVSQLADMVWDIYVRRGAEEALRESQRRLATLMGNLPGMAYRCRNDRDWTMEFVSQGCAALTGYAPNEIQDNAVVSYGGLIHAEDGEGVWRAVQEGVQARRPFQMTYRIINRAGEVRWVWEQGSGVFEDGRLQALEGFIADITERKQAEEQRLVLERQVQQAQKLESLGVLAGGIAHDFNNILTAVLGYSDLAIADLPSSSPARSSVLQISTAALRAAGLCRQMLAYAGRASFCTERVDLRSLIGEMVHLLNASISKKAVLSLNLDPDLPGIRADPSQVRQIVMNLIINASEAIGAQSGVITVSASAVRCDAGRPSDAYLDNTLVPGLYVQLSVADTGCGMDAPTKARMFEPFYTTKFAGRGLGLAAVLGIVRAHKGALSVQSAAGSGTTFTILLPALEAGSRAGDCRASAPEPEWRGRGTVLFVDDEPTLRDLGAGMLGRLGFSVLTAADGREALELYRRRGGEIDVVMMDLTMPEMDGAEAVAEIRRINPAARIVLASGYGSQDLEDRFAGEGLAGVIQKPYSLDKLREVLSRVRDGWLENSA